MTTNTNQQTISFLDMIWEYKGTLALYIVGISFLTFVGLYLLGGVPDELKVVNQTPDPSLLGDTVQAASTASSTAADAHSTQGGELPVKVIIDKIGVNTIVSNPNTTDNDILNTFLLRGAVRYPGSGTLGDGNVFIFGHNTSIKIVNNQAYKTFNGLKDLNLGDTIKVDSSDKEYTYTVTSVSLEDADAAIVDLTTTKNMLTLSTCDVFGEKQQRFVVQAQYVSVSSL